MGIVVVLLTALLYVTLPYYITKEKADNFFDYIISIPHLTITLLTYKIPVPIWIIICGKSLNKLSFSLIQLLEL